MPTLEEKINALTEKRKGYWTDVFHNDLAKAAELLGQYGIPNQFEAAVAGVQQGLSHGFADDIERGMRGDGRAVNQIRAQAAHPLTYTLSTLAGTGAAGLGLRKSGELAADVAVANAKRGSTRMGAGVDRNAAKNAAKVEETRKKWGQFPFPGVKPAQRATLMDALHGAAWGYGGADVSEDEEAFDLERLKRAAIGAGAAGLMSPLVVSGIGAAGNIPLTWSGRRIGSKKMYEPPGVTKANPKGEPRRAIDIAKAKDEVAARGMRLPDETGRTENAGRLNRDPVPPMESTMPRTQKLADQVLAVRAPERIADLKGQQREAAAAQISAAYPRPPEPDLLPAPAGAQPDMFEPRRSIVPDSQLDDLARVFTREQGPDRPVLESFFGRLQALDKQDPTVMPRMRAIMARVLSENERQNPVANDAPPMRAFVNRFGMAGSKSGNRPPVIESAREAATAQFPTQRLDDALQRTRTMDYPVRPRHADAIEAEMQGYQQPQYVDPALAREQPLIARGDDKAAWVNPFDFAADIFTKREKTPDWAVNWAGGLSGPIAYGTESFLASREPRGEWREPDLSQMRDPPPQRRQAAITPPPAPATQAQTPPVMPPVVQRPQITAPPAPAPERRESGISEGPAVKQAQDMLAPILGIKPDALSGPETRGALAILAIKSGMPGLPRGITPETLADMLAQDPELEMRVLQRAITYLSDPRARADFKRTMGVE